MKKSRFIVNQIVAMFQQDEAGASIADLFQVYGMSSNNFYQWRLTYGGMDASLIRRLKELEAENARLKKMYAEERLQAEIVKEALAKKW